MAVRAATEELAAVGSNGTGATNMMDFEELSDIIRCADLSFGQRLHIYDCRRGNGLVDKWPEAENRCLGCERSTCVTTAGLTVHSATCSMPRMVNETDIVELELKSKRFNLSVKKKEALKAEQPVQVWCSSLGPH